MIKYFLLFALLIFIIPNVSSCGYFLHEDSGSRLFYSPVDRLLFIEDNVMKITRLPTAQERQLNIYILQSSEPINYVTK